MVANRSRNLVENGFETYRKWLKSIVTIIYKVVENMVQNWFKSSSVTNSSKSVYEVKPG
jgi:hypothetical protein